MKDKKEPGNASWGCGVELGGVGRWPGVHRGSQGKNSWTAQLSQAEKQKEAMHDGADEFGEVGGHGSTMSFLKVVLLAFGVR